MEWWPEFRDRMIKRDNFTCLDCGYTTLSNQKETGRTWAEERTWTLHHIVPISKGGPMWDEDNVETLCERCHRFKHRMRSLEPTMESKQEFLDRYLQGGKQ